MLRIVDISVPSSLKEVGRYYTESWFWNTGPDIIWDVYVQGDYAYLANGLNGIRIVDISDPERPPDNRYVGAYHTQGGGVIWPGRSLPLCCG